MKLHKITFALILLFSGTSHAGAKFFTDWNCEGHSFFRIGGRISNLKSVTYKYGCELVRYGARGEIEIPYWGECEGSFDDRILSVQLSDRVAVEIFEHTKFHGDSEFLNGEGCMNLRHLPREGSSIIIHQ